MNMGIVLEIIIYCAAVTILLMLFEEFCDRKRESRKRNKSKHPWYPIHLSTNLHGKPVTHSCGAPSTTRLRAVYRDSESDGDPEGYKVEFYDAVTGRVVSFDPQKQDHQELYEHFLWIIHDFAREYIHPKDNWPYRTLKNGNTPRQ